MNEKNVSLFRVEYKTKDNAYTDKEFFILSDSYDQAERVVLEENEEARILSISKLAVSPLSLLFDENIVTSFK